LPWATACHTSNGTGGGGGAYVEEALVEVHTWSCTPFLHLLKVAEMCVEGCACARGIVSAGLRCEGV
jgi:hypothetical protein